MCVAIGISIHFNEHWLNSSHPDNKLRFDKVWKFESESVFGAQWLHSRPTWGPSESGCSRQNRGPVWSPQQSQQRISVFLTQHFHCTNTGTHSATQSIKRQTAWFLYAALKSKNWPQSGLTQLAMPDIFFQKFIPMSAGKKKSPSSDGQRVIPELPALNRPLWELTWGQSYYSLTRTQVHTTNSHLLNRGS